MPGHDENFTDNPFLRLNLSRFPSQRVPDAEHDEGVEFLRAMERLENAPRPKKTGGFKISEQCAWPAVAPRLKKPERQKKEAPKEAVKMPEDNDGHDEFLLAMRQTEPLGGKGRKVAKAVAPAAQAINSARNFDELVEESLEFALMHSDEYLEGHVLGLDDMLMGRLKAGQLSPEAHLDLHGLNSAQAFEALRDFIRASWHKGLRVVLLVPGRGLNSPNGKSVLRQKLQTWLTQEPFKRVVLAFCTAQPHDGGPGSVYALLRKYRKKGRIHWDCWPAEADLY